jgi:hypothetical protein
LPSNFCLFTLLYWANLPVASAVQHTLWSRDPVGAAADAVRPVWKDVLSRPICLREPKASVTEGPEVARETA